MVVESGWISPLLKELTPRPLESTWDDPHSELTETKLLVVLTVFLFLEFKLKRVAIHFSISVYFINQMTKKTQAINEPCEVTIKNH